MTLVSLGSLFLVAWVCKGLIKSQEPVLVRQLDLIDKMTTIAASRDVAAYQGLQVMDKQIVGYDGDNYDPSDAAQARREAERDGLDYEELSDGDAEALREAFAG